MYISTLMRLWATSEWLREGEGVGTGAGDDSGKKPNGAGAGATGAGDDDDDDTDGLEEPTQDYKQRAKEWEKYAKRLRTENANRRSAIKEANAKIAELQDKIKTETEAIRTASKSELDSAITKAKKEGSDRLVRMETKLALQAEGCKEVEDALKIADLSGIKITETGDVDIDTVKATVKALKESKAYLFGAASTSSTSTAKEPKKEGDDKPKSALEMTKEEYAAAKRGLLKSPVLIRR